MIADVLPRVFSVTKQEPWVEVPFQFLLQQLQKKSQNLLISGVKRL